VELWTDEERFSVFSLALLLGSTNCKQGRNAIVHRKKTLDKGLILADLVWSSGRNILIADRMIGLSIFAKGIFQVPFFSIVVEEVLERIMANIAALEKCGSNEENSSHGLNSHHRQYHHCYSLDKRQSPTMQEDVRLLVRLVEAFDWFAVDQREAFPCGSVLRYSLRRLSILALMHTMVDFVVASSPMHSYSPTLSLVYSPDSANRDDACNTV
jgi:hypothetical protein